MPSSEMKILVVDDSPTMRQIVRSSLKELGYTNVVEADGGLAAIDRLRHDIFDFVITDWNMPDLMGIDLLRQIRGNSTLHHLPVLMITAEASKECVLEAVKAGVNNFVLKPFTTQILEDKIRKIYANRSE